MDRDIRLEKIDTKQKKVVYIAEVDTEEVFYHPRVEETLKKALEENWIIRAHFEEDEITKIHKAWKEIEF